jgi:hypothetical protein
MAKFYGKSGADTGVKGVPSSESTTKYKNPYKPLTPGNLNDVASIDKQISNQTSILNKNKKPRKA